MRRRALTLIAAGALGFGAALGIAACGDDDEDTEIAPVEIDDTEPSGQQTGEATSVPETVPETTTEESGGYGY